MDQSLPGLEFIADPLVNHKDNKCPALNLKVWKEKEETKEMKICHTLCQKHIHPHSYFMQKENTFGRITSYIGRRIEKTIQIFESFSGERTESESHKVFCSENVTQ